MAEAHSAHSEHSEPGIRPNREQLLWAGKILGGIAFAIIALGVVAPIVLAVIVGLADGH